MIRSKLALAVAATAAVGLSGATAAMASTEPPATEPAADGTMAEGSMAPAGSAAAGGEVDADGDGYVTLDEACASYGGVQAPEGFRVNLVTDIGKVDDGTFNQFAYEGMEAAAACFGFETSFIETATEADYAANIATSLDASPNVVITVGFLLTDATAEAATANPDVSFIGVDQFLPEYPANMAGEQFAEDQAGYVAGVFAANLSETGVIGVVGGLESVPPVVKYVNGYNNGALSVNPDITVLQVYNDSFTDPAAGASNANQFIGEGADVIFGAGGQTGSGGVSAAAEQGIWGIGVDQDEYFTTFSGGSAPGADHLATSAMKRVDLSTFQLIASAVAGEFQAGLAVGSAENGMIALAPTHDADIPAEVVEAAEAALAGLADGSITTGVNPDGTMADGSAETAGSAAPAGTDAMAPATTSA